MLQQAIADEADILHPCQTLEQCIDLSFCFFCILLAAIAIAQGNDPLKYRNSANHGTGCSTHKVTRMMACGMLLPAAEELVRHLQSLGR